MTMPADRPSAKRSPAPATTLAPAMALAPSFARRRAGLRLSLPVAAALMAALSPLAAAAQVSPMLDPGIMAEASGQVAAERSGGRAAPETALPDETRPGGPLSGARAPSSRPLGGKLLQVGPGAAETAGARESTTTASGGKMLRVGEAATSAAAAPGLEPNQASPTPADVSSAVAALRFTPSAALRAEMRASAVAGLDGNGAGEDADDLRAALTSPATDAAISEHLGGFGMSADNVADATALYLATAWAAANGVRDEPTPGQMRGLRDQVALTYAASPGMAGATDQTKQQIAEASIVSTILVGRIGADAEKVTEEPRLAEQARAGVAEQVKDIFGLDLMTLKLTDDGLR